MGKSFFNTILEKYKLLQRKIRSMKDLDSRLFIAAVMIVFAGVFSFVRVVILLFRFICFDPEKIDIDDPIRQYYWALFNEEASFTNKYTSMLEYLQKPTYLKVIIVIVIFLHLVALIIMYFRCCKDNVLKIIPGITFLICFPTSVTMLVLKKVFQMERVSGIPDFPIYIVLVISIISLVITVVFAGQTDDYPIANGKYFGISFLITCIIIPAITYILYTIGLIMLIAIVVKILGSVILLPISSEHSYTVIDNDTGERNTYIKKDD